MQKLFIKNRDDVDLAVVIEETPNQKGLAFVMHGQGGFKEQPHVRTFIESFLEKGYTVISFDTANTIGESGGKFEDASITSYYADLEDVIEWAKSQKWYQEPFVLSGHSLGGICTALYAENNPEKIKGVAPVSPVVSGKLSWEAHADEIEEWKRTGWKTSKSNSKPGVIKRLKWSNMEDRLKYDLLPKADKLTMPVLIIVGEEDTSTPLKHQKILFDKIPGDKKELHNIKGAPHTFRDPEHLKEIKQIFLEWIDRI